MFQPETMAHIRECLPDPAPEHTPVPLQGPLKAERANLVQSIVLRDAAGTIVGAAHVALPYLGFPGETEDQRKTRLENLVVALMEQINEAQG